jgi:hypothetical protein
MSCSLTITEDVCGWFIFLWAPFTSGIICPSKFENVTFRWYCPVNTPTAHLNWSLFNFNRSFVLWQRALVEVPLSLWDLLRIPNVFIISVQSLTAFLATPIEMPQAGSGPMNGCSDPAYIEETNIFQTYVPVYPFLLIKRIILVHSLWGTYRTV